MHHDFVQLKVNTIKCIVRILAEQTFVIRFTIHYKLIRCPPVGEHFTLIISFSKPFPFRANRIANMEEENLQ